MSRSASARQIPTPWLGPRRGRLGDWLTQRWVQATGRRVSSGELPWLETLAGDTDVIGTDFFTRFAAREGLDVVPPGTAPGLVPDLGVLEGPDCAVGGLHPGVRAFYERTADYELDVWSEWSGLFRPFGTLLALLFSRRLQQLNVPLSPLDSRLGMTSEILQLRTRTGRVAQTAWVRALRATGHTLYAGSYSVCHLPGRPGPCIRVVFPLPNGNAQVILAPRSHADGSLTISSRGERFGDPGFYFYLRGDGAEGWARHVPSMKEDIRVYASEGEDPRADHRLELWGRTFLKLHYRMRRSPGAARQQLSPSTAPSGGPASPSPCP